MEEKELTARGPAPRTRAEAWLACEAAAVEFQTRLDADKAVAKLRRNLRKVGAALFAFGYRPNQGKILVRRIVDGGEEWVAPPIVGAHSNSSRWALESGWYQTYVVNAELSPLRAAAQVIAHAIRAGGVVGPNVVTTRRADASTPLVTPAEASRLVKLDVDTSGIHPASYVAVGARPMVTVTVELLGFTDPNNSELAERAKGIPSAWGVGDTDELKEHLQMLFHRQCHAYILDTLPVGVSLNREMCQGLFD